MKLSDTQLVILSAASQRDNGLALPLPKSLRGGAAHKVVHALIKASLIEEVEALKGDEVWRTTGDGHGVTLVITGYGYDAIGADRRPGLVRLEKQEAAEKAKAEKKPPKAAAAPTEGKTPREGTKQATMIDMLRRKDGATLAEIVEVTGWQQHTVRGAMAGALKKKLGLTIIAAAEERGRVYRIA